METGHAAQRDVLEQGNTSAPYERRVSTQHRQTIFGRPAGFVLNLIMEEIQNALI
jgi:hypothetical protein